ncbi:MAG: acyl-CoA/acyl-ACP dehydrogenase [Halioglobus sp.]|nr:acyl-CoA/acyl-ACP dehydrogenase [Halioglobus sp.]
MQFRFTEEQEMIRATAEAFLAEQSSSAAVRAAMVTERGYDTELWQRMAAEMCWQAMHIPEAYGGLGLGYVELVATLEQMGRYLLCSPFHATVCMAGNALLVAGNEAQKSEYLPQLAAGTTGTLVYTGGSGRWDAHAVEAICVPDGDSYRLSGRYRYVPDGHTAQLLVVAARAEGSTGEDGISLFVLPADTAGISRQWLPTMDQTRRQAQLEFTDVQVPATALLGEAENGWTPLATIIDLATVAVSADQVGGAQQSLDITLAYLKERVQFGRVIASYQAVKHKAADMMVKVEGARSAAYYAACIGDEALSGGTLGGELADAASIAKAYCSDAYFFNAGCGIQLHGGVGFTAEYDIQLYFKRAKSTETFLGNAAWHRERLARLLLDAPVHSARRGALS